MLSGTSLKYGLKLCSYFALFLFIAQPASADVIAILAHSTCK